MRFFLILLSIGALLALLVWQFPYAAQTQDEKMRLIYLITLLVLIVGSTGKFRNVSSGQIMRDAALWIAILLVIVLGYSFRNDLPFKRLAGEFMPSRIQTNSQGELTIRSGEDGHFHVEAMVNGTSVLFMVDTGASDIVLSPRDAQRAGYDTSTLNYSRTYRTANGSVGGAPVKIQTMVIGPVALHDVHASVNSAQMDQSLLGMSFMRQFKSYRVDGDVLTLTP